MSAERLAKPGGGPGFRSSAGGKPPYQTVSRGACVNVTRLDSGDDGDDDDRQQYRFTVVAYSRRHGEGKPASVTAAATGGKTLLQSGWRCQRVPGCRPGPFNSCGKASGDIGNSGGGSGGDGVMLAAACRAVEASGRCGDAWNLDINYANRQVLVLVLAMTKSVVTLSTALVRRRIHVVGAVLP